MFPFPKCLRWSSLKAVSVPTSVIGGLRGSTATSDLVWEVISYRFVQVLQSLKRKPGKFRQKAKEKLWEKLSLQVERYFAGRTTVLKGLSENEL